MQSRLRSLHRHPLMLVFALLLLALGLPYLAGVLAPSTVTALLWLDFATLGLGLLAALVLLLRWRVSAYRSMHASATTPSTEPSTKPSTKPTAAPLRYRAHAHRWLGRLLAVPLSWLLLTGSLTLYRAELDLWLTPALRHCCESVQPLTSQATPATQVAAQAQSMAAISQQLLHAQQYLAVHAAASSDWYVEFASARKPYLTLHWQDASTLQRQYLSVAGQPLGAVMSQPFGVQSQTFGGLVFDLHYTLLGRAWLEPLKRAVQPWLTLPVTGLGLAASLALLWLLLTCSGLWVSWRWWRQGRAGSNRLRWHVYAGLGSALWLLLYGASALVMQLGNWRDIPNSIGAATYYAELFPQPQLPAVYGPGLSTSAAAVPAGPLSAEQIQQLVRLWPATASAVSKLHWPRDAEPAIWQLTGSAMWPAQGPVMPMQASQRLQDGVIAYAHTNSSSSANTSINSSANTSTPWQWRHALYQLHQSYYLTPWSRAVMFALGLLAWVGVLLALRQPSAKAFTGESANMLVNWPLQLASSVPLLSLGFTAVFLQLVETSALALFGYGVAASVTGLLGWRGYHLLRRSRKRALTATSLK